MAKRLFTSVLLGVVVCGVLFYLGYFVALIGTAVTGPLNPANAPGLQSWLRHWMLPASVAVGVVIAVLAFWRLGAQQPEKKPSKLLHFR
jgi:hypothetical protein